MATLWEPRVEGCLLIQLHLCLQKDIKMEKTRTEPMSRNALFLTNLSKPSTIHACSLIINFSDANAGVLYVV